MKGFRFGFLAALSLTLVFAASPSHARSIKSSGIKDGGQQTAARPSPEYRVHDVGAFWSAVSNFGNYGEPNTTLPSGEWPGGSGVYYIWEGRFWFGAIVGGVPLVSHADYGNYELDPSEGSSFFFGSGGKSIQDGVVEFDDMTDYQGHTPIGIKVRQRSMAWSLPEYDDYLVFNVEVTNVSGGTLNGAMVVWVFDNDVGSGPGGDPDQPHIDDLVDYDGWVPPNEEDGQPFREDWVDPLDLDGDGITGYDYWGWPVADPRNPYWQIPAYVDEHVPETNEPEPDGIYDEYQIYLDPNGPVIYGQPGTIKEGEPITDADGNVLHGYLISRNTSYMFDGDYPQSGENDTGERTLTTPVAGFIGTRMIYIPMDPFYETPEDTIPRPYSHQWWNWESDPGSDKEKYEYMEGTHTLSQGRKFMPHPFDYGAGAPVFDYRYMHTIGPFNGWADGETKKFVMVTGVGWGLQGMREILDNAVVAYYKGGEEALAVIGDPVHPGLPEQVGFHSDIRQDGHFLLPIPPPIPDLHYSAGDESVDLVWDDYAERAIDSFIGRTDFEGYKIYRSKFNAQDWEMIAAWDNRSEPVFIRDSEGDTLNPVIVGGDTITFHEPGYEEAKAAGNFQYLPVDLPDIVHAYTDNGGSFVGADGLPLFRGIERPINGLKYYYVVVAYDPDKPDRGLTSSESSKANYRKTLDGAPDAVVPRTDAAPDNVLDNVRVVPNPYKGSAQFEAAYEDQVMFTNLPALSKISVFTMTGDLVWDYKHRDATSGVAIWNLISRNNQKVVSGLYIYVVETESEKKIGKMLIVR